MESDVRHWLVWLGWGLALAGCASVESVDGARYRVPSAEFRRYVEQVFRAQNQTADRLAFAIEDLSSAETQAAGLGAAEARLLMACADLNRLAVSQRDGVALGARASLAAARSAPDCERARRAADEILGAID